MLLETTIQRGEYEYFISSSAYTWNYAYDFCQEDGHGRLAIIRNEEEFDITIGISRDLGYR